MRAGYFHPCFVSRKEFNSWPAQSLQQKVQQTSKVPVLDIQFVSAYKIPGTSKVIGIRLEKIDRKFVTVDLSTLAVISKEKKKRKYSPEI